MPGEYRFRVTGQSGTRELQYASVEFKLILEDLCSTTVVMTLVQPDFFSDSVYPLGEPEIEKPFDRTTLYALSPNLDCGPTKIDFYHFDLADGVTKTLNS